MSVVAEFAVPADEFVLGEALQADPEMTVELERFVPSGQEMLPFFWAWNEDFEAFEEAAEAHIAIEQLTVIEREGNVALYEVEWTPGLSTFLQVIVESEATVIEATGSADGWSFGLRFPGREALRAFQSTCDDNGVTVSLQRLHHLTAVTGNRNEYGLTEKQRETLLIAYREGYFDDPRGTSLAELSETFDISARAVSQRLRRGCKNLISNALATGD